MKTKIFFIIAFAACSAFAQHENCKHGTAPSLSTSGDGSLVRVPPQAAKNVKLEIEEAKERNLDKIITATGIAELMPQNISVVSSRTSGMVKKLFAYPNMKVKKGELLFTLESRQIGNPPPTIEFEAPRDGVVISSALVEGTPVEPNAVLMQIADTSKLYAVAQVYESKLSELKIGESARIRFDAIPNTTFTAKLAKFGGELSSNYRLPVYFELDNPEGKIKPNMRGIFDIVTDSEIAKVSIQKSAVSGDFGNYFIYVLKCPDDMEFEKRSVVLGKSDDRFVEIIEGLKAHEKVAIRGVYQLQFMPSAEDDSHQEKPVAHEHSETCSHSDSAEHKPVEGTICTEAEKNHAHAECETNEHAHTACTGHDHADCGEHEDEEENSIYKKTFFIWLLGFSLLFNFLFIFASMRKRKA